MRFSRIDFSKYKPMYRMFHVHDGAFSFWGAIAVELGFEISEQGMKISDEEGNFVTYAGMLRRFEDFDKYSDKEVEYLADFLDYKYFKRELSYTQLQKLALLGPAYIPEYW